MTREGLCRFRNDCVCNNVLLAAVVRTGAA
jgi:hypothetical protein